MRSLARTAGNCTRAGLPCCCGDALPLGNPLALRLATGQHKTACTTICDIDVPLYLRAETMLLSREPGRTCLSLPSVSSSCPAWRRSLACAKSPSQRRWSLIKITAGRLGCNKLRPVRVGSRFPRFSRPGLDRRRQRRKSVEIRAHEQFYRYSK